MRDIVAVLAYPVIGELAPGKTITTHRRVLDAVKRSCLIFDRIAVAYFGWPRIAGEKYADWLDDAETSVALEKHRIWYRKDATRIIHRLEELNAPRTQHLADELRAYLHHHDSRLTSPQRLIVFDYLSRILACGLRELGEADAVPLIFRRPPAIGEKGEPVAARADDVLQVVVSALPQPISGTPIDRIIRFRADAETKSKLLLLRRWMRNVPSSGKSVAEVKDELEYLLNEYESYMRLQKLKIEYGTLESIVTTGADVLENVAKFNLGKLARLPFEIKRRRIALLEAEHQAPGRDVAYISSARSRFA